MTRHYCESNKDAKAYLYVVVFNCSYVKFLSVLLFVFFILNPVVRAEAEEVTEVSDESVKEKVIAEVEPPKPVIEEKVEEKVIEETEDNVTDIVEDTSENEVTSTEVLEELSDHDGDEKSALSATDEVAEISTEHLDEQLEVTVPELLDQKIVTPEVAGVATTAPLVVVEVGIQSDVAATTTDNVVNETSSALDTSTGTTSSTSTSKVLTNHSPSGSGRSDGSSQIASSSDLIFETVAVATTTDEVNESADGDITVETSSENSEETDIDSVRDEVFSEVTDIVTNTSVISTSTDHLASSSVITATASPAVVVKDTSINALSFDETECKAVGDGSYYCTDANTVKTITEDAIFAAPDSDGDMEIYVRIGGKQTKITDNRVDDSAPYYDHLSDRIVWHSLINDRYQIMSYDLTTGATVQVTDTTYNNMQPMAHGEMVFWQAWINDNWEIVRLEGNEVIQMTDNDVHDIGPYAQDNYVMWQTQSGNEWKTSLFDITTGKHEFIETDTDGVTKNPRLVLMYESYDANGDVRVFGYDLKNKEYVNLAQTPTSLPVELPGPVEDEEERALIQAKPTVRENEDNNDDDLSAPVDPVINPAIGTSTPTSTDDVIVPPRIEEISATSTGVVDIDVIDMSTSTVREQAEAEVERLLEETLVKKSLDTIEDVVIPPLVTSTEEFIR